MSIKNIGDRINPDSVKFVQANAIEENILGLLLIYDEYRQSVSKGEIELTDDDFVTSFGKKVFTAVMELQNGTDEFLPALLGERFSADEMGRIEKTKQNRLALTENGRSVFEASVQALKAERKALRAKENGDKFSALRAKQEKLKELKSQK